MGRLRDPESGLNEFLLQIVQWAHHAARPLLEHVGVDHGGGDILVAQQRLNGADIRAALQQMGGETVTKRVGAHFFMDTGLTDGLGNGFIDGAWVQMVAPLDAAARIR